MGWFSNNNRRSLSRLDNEIQDDQVDPTISVLNMAEGRFESAINSGNWKSIQQAHHVREETRRAIEENSEAPRYESDHRRWFSPSRAAK